jgi:3D (Asp-Asp-Asp) domain-containing protein
VITHVLGFLAFVCFLGLCLTAECAEMLFKAPGSLPGADSSNAVSGRGARGSYASQEPVWLCIRAKVTAYCACRICCGKHANGRTSRNRDAKLPGVAVDPCAIPYGSQVKIPGKGTFLADDTGGAMRQSWKKKIYHVDLRMKTHKEARRWGVRWMNIYVKECR